jgi:hypothetical protein
MLLLIACTYLQIVEIHVYDYDIDSIRLSILLNLPHPNSD